MIPIRDINPTRQFAVVTVLFIFTNVSVFVYQLLLSQHAESAFISSFALIPRNLFAGAHPEGVIPTWATVFTSMFLHGSLVHIGGNMLYLWIFGNNIEDSMGKMRFILFYALCGVAAAYAHALFNADSRVPMIGASGAISGVLGAYLMLFPRARVVTLIVFGFYIRTVEVPALIVLGFWLILQFINVLVSAGAGSGIAWHAHVGGFIAGVFLVGLFKKGEVPFGAWRRDRYQ